MRAKAWWAGAAIAGFFFGAGVANAQGDTYRSSNRSGRVQTTTAVPVNDWWWPFGRDELRQSREQQAIATGMNNPDPKIVTSPARAPSVKEATAQIDQAMQDYFRRLAICDKIKQIAEETGDPALEAQAELLQQRAWMICQQRIDRLRMPGLLPDGDAAATEVLTAEKSTQRPAVRSEVRTAPVRSIRGDGSISGGRE